MKNQRLDKPLRLMNGRAVAGIIDGLTSLDEKIERPHIIAHVSFGRGDHACIPAHHMVARKKNVLAGHKEAKVIGRMARRVDGLRLPSLAVNMSAMLKRDVE